MIQPALGVAMLLRRVPQFHEGLDLSTLVENPVSLRFAHDATLFEETGLARAQAVVAIQAANRSNLNRGQFL